ncbi:hypothetical protein QD336_15295 [Rhizobium sp. BR 250]
MTETPQTPQKKFITANDVCARYGRVTTMTLHRWLTNPDNDFPRPIRIGKLRFWEIAALDAYDAAKIAETAQ